MYFVTIKNNQTGAEAKAVQVEEDGPITFIGNYPEFIQFLKENSEITEKGTAKKLLPEDGKKYLENLQYSFDSGYLQATPVQEA